MCLYTVNLMIITDNNQHEMFFKVVHTSKLIVAEIPQRKPTFTFPVKAKKVGT